MSQETLEKLARETAELVSHLKAQKDNGVSPADFQRLVVDLASLVAELKVRCPQQGKEIEANREDIDQAFSRIRKVEQALQASLIDLRQSLQDQIHILDRQQAKWSGIIALLASLLTSGVTMGLMKLFGG